MDQKQAKSINEVSTSFISFGNDIFYLYFFFTHFFLQLASYLSCITLNLHLICILALHHTSFVSISSASSLCLHTAYCKLYSFPAFASPHHHIITSCITLHSSFLTYPRCAHFRKVGIIQSLAWVKRTTLALQSIVHIVTNKNNDYSAAVASHSIIHNCHMPFLFVIVPLFDLCLTSRYFHYLCLPSSILLLIL